MHPRPMQITKLKGKIQGTEKEIRGAAAGRSEQLSGAGTEGEH